MIVVSNSGPLIALAQINRLALLSDLYQIIIIPEAVHVEVSGQGNERPGANFVRSASWIEAVTVENQLAVALLRQRLDPGESEAIVLAIEQNADLLLMDERRGRQIAQAQGVVTSETLGVLLAAKQAGRLGKVTPVLDDLRGAGFRMGWQLYQQIKITAGE